MKVPLPKISTLKCAKVEGVGVKVPLPENNLENKTQIFQNMSEVANHKTTGDLNPTKQCNKGAKMPAGVNNIAKDSARYQVAKPKVNTSLGAIPKVRTESKAKSILRERNRRESSAKEISTTPEKREEQATMSSVKERAEKPSLSKESSQDVAGGSEQKMPPTLDLGAEKSSQKVTDGRE